MRDANGFPNGEGFLNSFCLFVCPTLESLFCISFYLDFQKQSLLTNPLNNYQIITNENIFCEDLQTDFQMGKVVLKFEFNKLRPFKIKSKSTNVYCAGCYFFSWNKIKIIQIDLVSSLY